MKFYSDKNGKNTTEVLTYRFLNMEGIITKHIYFIFFEAFIINESIRWNYEIRFHIHPKLFLALYDSCTKCQI